MVLDNLTFGLGADTMIPIIKNIDLKKWMW